MADEVHPLGIISGGGQMPNLVAESVVASGRSVVIIALAGFFNSNSGRFPLVSVSPGQVSALFAALRSHHCQDIVMVGEMRRPNLRDLRFDWGIIQQLPTLFQAKGRGDDGAMRLLTRIFERQGFRVKSLRDVAPSLAASFGVIGSVVPNQAASEAIRFGLTLLNANSSFDIGQSVIVHRRRILAIEAAEGTNAMIDRIGELRANGRFSVKAPSGILVKQLKLGQELRNDMPVIGPQTIEAAARAGLEGIAIGAGGVAIGDRTEVTRLADAAGLFVVGCDITGAWSSV